MEIGSVDVGVECNMVPRLKTNKRKPDLVQTADTSAES